MNTKRYTHRYNTVKPLKSKERDNLESSKRRIIHVILGNDNVING